MSAFESKLTGDTFQPFFAARSSAEPEARGSLAVSALAPCQLLGQQGKGCGCLLTNSTFTLLLLQSDTFAKASDQNGVKGSLYIKRERKKTKPKDKQKMLSNEGTGTEKRTRGRSFSTGRNKGQE